MNNRWYLDSNFLIYLKNEGSPFHGKAKEIHLEIIKSGGRLFISALTIDEFLHSFGKELKQGKKEVYKNLHLALEQIFVFPEISIVSPPNNFDAHLSVVNLMGKYHLHARDAYHLMIMQTNFIDGFVTFDNDFEKVFSAKILQKGLLILPS